jgi:hypothetical protein
MAVLMVHVHGSLLATARLEQGLCCTYSFCVWSQQLMVLSLDEEGFEYPDDDAPWPTLTSRFLTIAESINALHDVESCGLV